MKNSDKLDKSNFNLIERLNKHIIQNVEEHDLNGRLANRRECRKTYKLKDGSYLSVVEKYMADDLNKIDFYHYDWYERDKQTIKMKFHSEPHKEKKVQTETEPYHIHKPNKSKGINECDRIANYSHRTLLDIFECISLSI